MKLLSTDDIQKALGIEGKRERKKLLKELRWFLTVKGYNPNDFFKWEEGRGKQYFIPETLAKEFIEYYKRRIAKEREVIINEEYFKIQESIKEQLKKFEKELAKELAKKMKVKGD